LKSTNLRGSDELIGDWQKSQCFFIDSLFGWFQIWIWTIDCVSRKSLAWVVWTANMVNAFVTTLKMAVMSVQNVQCSDDNIVESIQSNFKLNGTFKNKKA
jgi:hypothetical protein